MPAPTIPRTGIGSAGSTWREPVQTPADLPAIGLPGEVHVVLDDGDGRVAHYTWNETYYAWEKTSDPDWSGGSGDVIGPTGATPNSIVVFDGSTGKVIKEATGFIWDDVTQQIIAPSGLPLLDHNLEYFNFVQTQRVPSYGVLYLKNSCIPSSTAGLYINQSGIITNVSFILEKADSIRDYQLEILINGTVQYGLSIPAGTVSNLVTGLTISLSSSDLVKARLVKQTGVGVSSFRRCSVSMGIHFY